MAEHWMTVAEAAGVLKCDETTLRRWADAGQVRARGGGGARGMEVMMDVAAAPSVEELAGVAAAAAGESGRESAIALALARAAREDADRSRRSLRRAVGGLVALSVMSVGVCGFLAFRVGTYRAAAEGTASLLAAEQEKSAILSEDRERFSHQYEQAVADAADAELKWSKAKALLTEIDAGMAAFGSPGLSDIPVAVAAGERQGDVVLPIR